MTGSENLIATMRVGMAGGMYPVPESVPQEETPLWLLRRSAELGCTALQTRLPPSQEGLERLRGEAEALGIELECGSPHIFTPLGTAPAESAEGLRDDLRRAKAVGSPLVRSGYGRLTVETSRYDRGAGAVAHLKHMTACLRQAAKLAEEAEMRVAVENHCDFTGRELAGVLAEVDSAWVGAATDTGNGYTVFCDCNDDVEVLAPYTFTTHMKDMVIERSPFKGMVPFSARGCRLGDGHVDIAGAVRQFAERSPYAAGLHLLVESGWPSLDPAEDTTPLRRDILEHGTRYLIDLIGGKKATKA